MCYQGHACEGGFSLLCKEGMKKRTYVHSHQLDCQSTSLGGFKDQAQSRNTFLLAQCHNDKRLESRNLVIRNYTLMSNEETVWSLQFSFVSPERETGFFSSFMLKYDEKNVIIWDTSNVHVYSSYRSAGIVARLSAITYDRLGPQLELHIIQYKSWSNGICYVPPLSPTPQRGRCHCWATREGQSSHWVHNLKVRT